MVAKEVDGLTAQVRARFDVKGVHLARRHRSDAMKSPTGIGPKLPKRKKFVVIPLYDDWGYRAMTTAGRGAAIVLHALYVQKTTGQGDVPITAALLRRHGLTRKMRWITINRLVAAGLATVRYRGKFCGCPLLTLLVPI
jgi:hypothetical protein